MLKEKGNNIVNRNSCYQIHPKIEQQIISCNQFWACYFITLVVYKRCPKIDNHINKKQKVYYPRQDMVYYMVKLRRVKGDLEWNGEAIYDSSNHYDEVPSQFRVVIRPKYKLANIFLLHNEHLLLLKH